MRKNFQKVLAGLSIVLVFLMMQEGSAFGSYCITKITDLDKRDKNKITSQRYAMTGNLLVKESLAEPW